jgi:ubiquinone/menaquinone biosynthesis C-methylase UbiE
MRTYGPWYAELYDLLYADKPYQREAEFVDALLKEHSRGRCTRILDVACGTGSHSFWLESFGYDVTGIDASAEMIEQARRKAAARSSRVNFIVQDMRALDVPGPRFDAALCLFDSIGYARTNGAVCETLRGIRRHLRAEGLLILEYWHAAAMLTGYSPVRMRRVTGNIGTILRISQTHLDVAEGTAQVAYTLIQFAADGRARLYEETHTNRFFSVPEMEALLEFSGFRPLAHFDGFQRKTEITASTWHVLTVATVAEPPASS